MAKAKSTNNQKKATTQACGACPPLPRPLKVTLPPWKSTLKFLELTRNVPWSFWQIIFNAFQRNLHILGQQKYNF